MDLMGLFSWPKDSAVDPASERYSEIILGKMVLKMGLLSRPDVSAVDTSRRSSETSWFKWLSRQDYFHDRMLNQPQRGIVRLFLAQMFLMMGLFSWPNSSAAGITHPCCTPDLTWSQLLFCPWCPTQHYLHMYLFRMLIILSGNPFSFKMFHRHGWRTQSTAFSKSVKFIYRFHQSEQTGVNIQTPFRI